jgi:putative endonuclease
MGRRFYTYILASRPYGTLYTGHTDDLSRRIRQHKEKRADSFTAKYGVTQLVWLEGHDSREGAFRRERQIKEWRRKWKIELIEEENPHWRDLYDDLNNLLVL